MKLIAINRFTFDGYAAREMLFKRSNGQYVLIGSSESPDDVIDETPYPLECVFKWLAMAGDAVELFAVRTLHQTS